MHYSNLSITLPTELLNKLQSMADANYTTRSAFIKNLIIQAAHEYDSIEEQANIMDQEE